MSIRKFGTSDENLVNVDREDQQGVQQDTIRREASTDEWTPEAADAVINEGE